MTPAIRDAEFPGFPAALDLEGVIAALNATLPECRNGTRIVGGSVVDVRYRPGGPCWVLYNLKLRQGEQRTVRQLVSGRVLRDGEAPPSLPDAVVRRYETRTGSTLRTPVVVLPDIPLMAYAFPVDESLPGLFDATDPAAMRDHLNRLWHGRRVRVRRVHSRLLGYTPHARAALAYEVLSEARGTGVPELRRLVGKLHAKKEAARIFADAWAIWRAAGGRVRLAPPVGYVPAAGLTLQEMVPGTRLGGLVAEPGFARWVRRSARMLAQLHACPAPLSSRRRPLEEAETVHRWAGVLLTIRSDLAARVERLRDRVAAEVLSHARSTAPIHGDFHHTNILVDGNEVTFIDLDECALGDPMVDVGRFLASLRVPARRVFGSIGALRDAGEGFLESYLRAGRGDERRARLFEAASLLIAGASAFRIQRPTWVEEVAELLAEAETVLQAALTVKVPGPGTPRPDPRRESRPRWAGDGIFVQALLAPHIRMTYGADLLECRVTKGSHEGGTRRFRYDVRGTRDGKPWQASLDGVLKERGGGKAVLERVDSLRRMTADSSDALRFPRPVGHLGLLSLQVWEPPAGRRLARVAGTPEGILVAERLACGLASLHGAAVAFVGAPRTLDDDLRRLDGRLDRLSPGDRDAATRVRKTIEPLIHHIPVGFAPSLRGVHPKHVVWDGVQAGIARVEALGPAHPLIDVADFLARCAALSLEGDEPEGWAEIAARCRQVYLSVTGEDTADLACLEAAALLRLSCARGAVDRNPEHPRHLIALALARLQTQRTGR